jgi:hypothetical protein
MDVVKVKRSPSTGNNMILIFVELTSKWIEAFSIKEESGEVMSKALTEIVSRFNATLTSLNCDRGGGMMSSVFKDTCRTFGIHLQHSSSHYPRGDASAETGVRQIVSGLRNKLDDADDYEKALPMVLLAYRSSINKSTGFSPASLLYGTQGIFPPDLNIHDFKFETITARDYITDLIPRVRQMRSLAKRNILKAQLEYKKAYDKRYNVAQNRPYEIGDKVWLRRLNLTAGVESKLSNLYIGPFEIYKNVGNLNSYVFVLKNCASGKILKHPYNIQHLKAYIPRDPHLFTTFEDSPDESGLMFKEADETDDIVLNSQPVEGDPQAGAGNPQVSAGDPQVGASNTQVKLSEHVDDQSRAPRVCKPQTKKRAPQVYKPQTIDDVIDSETAAGDKPCADGLRSESDTNVQNEEVWYKIKRILLSKKVKNKRYYKILWSTNERTWIPEEDVTKDAKQLFHIKYTDNGVIRKSFKTTQKVQKIKVK